MARRAEEEVVEDRLARETNGGERRDHGRREHEQHRRQEPAAGENDRRAGARRTRERNDRLLAQVHAAPSASAVEASTAASICARRSPLHSGGSASWSSGGIGASCMTRNSI